MKKVLDSEKIRQYFFSFIEKELHLSEGNDQMVDLSQETARQVPESRKEDDEGQLALEIFESAASIFVIAPVAGVDANSLEISLTEDLLIIKGNRPRPKSLPHPQKVYAEECYWGPFSRNILLPSAVNSADMSARLESDIIVIEIPKARKATSKIISLTHRK